jgi:LysM domain-containing protein
VAAPGVVPEAAPAPIPEVVSTLPTHPPTDVSVPFHVPGLAATALTERAEAVVDATPAEVPTDDRRSWLQVLDDRSPDPTICPFLRATGRNGLVAPIETPATANRCAALAEAVPQSLRQQELVCLSTGHVNCPRYLRGAAVIAEAPTPVVREGRAMSPAMLGSLVVLVLALSASVGFVLARGGALDIAPPGVQASASPSAVAVASPSVVPSAPVVAPTSSIAVTPSPTPSVTPSPTPTAAPTAAPTPRATPRSDRYRLLRACPSTPRCWIYTVRSGDNVFSIARYFGVSQDSIYARNPWLRTRGLRAGQELRLPPPTR